MSEGPRRRKLWPFLAFAAAVTFLLAAYAVFRGDLIRYSLDPRTPFQTYRPPPPPDFSARSGWFLLPNHPEAPARTEPAADVFFIAPTTFDGGKNWNAPPNDADTAQLFKDVMAPNYVGPFVRLGRIFAPRYREASLYSQMNLSDDARQARAYPYVDIAAAFRVWRDRYGDSRPFILVGVEQGGTMAARLLADEIAPDPALRQRLVAAYLVETIVPADAPPISPCRQRGEAHCLAAWASAPQDDPARAQRILDRALVWQGAELDNLHGPALCFNPILGATSDALASERLHLGAANATGLDWNDRPAFLARQVSARCEGGLLRVSEPRSASLKPAGSWIERRRIPGFNLFYADLEADARARLAAAQVH